MIMALLNVHHVVLVSTNHTTASPNVLIVQVAQLQALDLFTFPDVHIQVDSILIHIERNDA